MINANIFFVLLILVAKSMLAYQISRIRFLVLVVCLKFLHSFLRDSLRNRFLGRFNGVSDRFYRCVVVLYFSLGMVGSKILASLRQLNGAKIEETGKKRVEKLSLQKGRMNFRKMWLLSRKIQSISFWKSPCCREISTYARLAGRS